MIRTMSILRARMWLAHHHQDQLERCTVVGRTHVCRRCLWSYPATFLVLGLSVFGLHWPAGWDAALGWGLPLAGVLDMVLENLGRISYSARRQAWTSLAAGVAFGRGTGRYVEHPGDRLFWSVALTYGALTGLSAVIAHRRRQASVRRAEEARMDEQWAAVERELFGT